MLNLTGGRPEPTLLLMSGDHRLVIRISPSPLEYWISTSDSADNQFLDRIREEGFSLQEAVIKAAEIAPFGIGNQKDLVAA